MAHSFSFIILLLLFISPAYSQITIDTSLSEKQLIGKEFLYGGVEVSNIRFTGSKQSLGLFDCTSNLFPLSKGILLSTGFASMIKGPNDEMGKSGFMFTAGDSTLEFIGRGKTYDACVIEFDFIPTSENAAFDFVFASEEYPEYVNSMFNDVFAFIVTNTETNEQINIAFLPNTHEPITVNNVNHLKNTMYFIDNANSDISYILDQRLSSPNNPKKKKKDDLAPIIPPCKKDLCKMLQYDGFTKMLTAKTKVIPGKTYHFKIAIADVQDRIYDSGVILRAHSFKSYDKYGFIKGDTTGYRVVDKDLEKYIPEENKIVNKLEVKKDTFFAVLFDFDSSQLSDSALRIVAAAADILKKDPKLTLNISGHTDNKGSELYNQELSVRRNESVKQAFKQLGIDSKRIQMKPFGERKPVSDNDSDLGRSLNRRVELEIK